MATTKEENFQKIEELINGSDITPDEKKTMIIVLSKFGEEELQGTLDLIKQEPALVKKISQNIQAKFSAVDAKDLSAWENIVKEEERELKKLENA